MSETWETLWDRAMIALDSLAPGFGGSVRWSFGGGTAMRLFYDHRLSRDIDIFVTDPSVISGLSPRLNGTTEELTDSYTGCKCAGERPGPDRRNRCNPRLRMGEIVGNRYGTRFCRRGPDGVRAKRLAAIFAGRPCGRLRALYVWIHRPARCV